MSIPNDFAIVQRIDAEHPHLIQKNTRETVAEFYWRAAWALHLHDSKWGMLSKSAGENHQVIGGQRVSVDAVAYKGETPIVDILKSAGDGPGTGGVTWGIVEERRESNLWVAPPPFHDTPPAPTPTPQPPAGDDRIDKLEAAVVHLNARILDAENNAEAAKSITQSLYEAAKMAIAEMEARLKKVEEIDEAEIDAVIKKYRVEFRVPIIGRVTGTLVKTS